MESKYDEELKDTMKIEDDIKIIYVDPFDLEIPKDETSSVPKTIICTEKDFSLDGMMTFELDVKSEEIISSVDNIEPSIPKHLVEQKLFTCSFCPKTFKRNYRLKLHHQTHTGERPYLCDHCSKSFSRKFRLREHLLRYFGHKNFSCNDCSIRFLSQWELNEHMRMHTGEMYQCNECLKTFSKKGYLRKHLHNHREQKQQKLYACQHGKCTKMFLSKSGLKYHERTHTGKKSSALMTHTRTHTKEKQFACDICLKAFVRRYQRTMHMRTHITKIYSCDQCSKTFSSITARKHHKLEAVHGIAILLIFQKFSQEH